MGRSIQWNDAARRSQMSRLTSVLGFMATFRAIGHLTQFVKLKVKRPAEARALMLSGTPSTC
jgi:hypothetical protein